VKRWLTWKRVLAGLGALALVALLAATWLVASEWRYIQRLRTYPDRPITTVEWYEPKARIAGGAERLFATASPAESGFEPAVLEAVAQYAKSKNSSALLVVYRDVLVFERYWQGHGPQKWSDSASMAKTLTALLIGIAIADGRIPSVDEPAATYLRKWAKDDRRRITLRNLLQMHSGLRPMGVYDDPFTDACYLALGTDARYVVNSCPAVRAPAEAMDYNNVNFQALGQVLEVATGRPFAEYLSEKFWVPLGNTDAAVCFDRPGGVARTFGFVFATARDWARVGLLIQHAGRLDGRQIVPADWIQFMCSPSPTDRSYGAGLYTGPDGEHPPFVAPDTVAINGHSKQRVYVIPSKQLVVVRLGENAKNWDDSRLPNLLIAGMHQ
jgi:CubicO group peptidase (beta-lactamase class C family)